MPMKLPGVAYAFQTGLDIVFFRNNFDFCGVHFDNCIFLVVFLNPRFCYMYPFLLTVNRRYYILLKYMM